MQERIAGASEQHVHAGCRFITQQEGFLSESATGTAGVGPKAAAATGAQAWRKRLTEALDTTPGMRKQDFHEHEMSLNLTCLRPSQTLFGVVPCRVAAA